jgi:hypothetical protein
VKPYFLFSNHHLSAYGLVKSTPEINSFHLYLTIQENPTTGKMNALYEYSSEYSDKMIESILKLIPYLCYIITYIPLRPY